MLIGIGTDMCRVDRVTRAAESEHFVSRVFSREEIEYSGSLPAAGEHLAASFAAKEALSKALGIGIFKMGAGSAWVSRTDDGPVMRCSGELQEMLDKRGVKKIWLSLTHEGGFALAFVILEG